MAKYSTPQDMIEEAQPDDARKIDYCHLQSEKPKMHYLRQPRCWSEGIAWGDLAYQVTYSVRVLERELSEQGVPHVLQLELDPQSYLDSPSGTIHNWTLYADGWRVAHGEGSFAQECFEKSADEFLNVCRQAVLAADLQKISTEEYELLKKVRNIAECAANGAEH